MDTVTSKSVMNEQQTSRCDHPLDGQIDHIHVSYIIHMSNMIIYVYNIYMYIYICHVIDFRQSTPVILSKSVTDPQRPAHLGG